MRTAGRTAVAVVAVFALLPLTTFLSDNRAETDGTVPLLVFTALLMAVGLVLVAVAARRRGRAAAERVAVLYGVATFVLFRYDSILDGLDAIGVPREQPRYALLVWLVVFVGALLVFRRLSRSAVVRQWLLVAGAVLVALNLVQYVAAQVGGERLEGEQRAVAAAEEHPGTARSDVWFFLLDGYGRADELQRVIDFDNRPFLRELERRGFDVAERAETSYALTYAALSSTLSLDYVQRAGRLLDSDSLVPIIRGDSVAVASLRRLGYEFVQATDYDPYGCEGYEDRCIEPDRGALEQVVQTEERTFLLATPIAPVLPDILRGLGFGNGILAPDDAARRAIDGAGDKPMFVWTHIMAPHPPYRFPGSCTAGQTAFDGALDDWGQAGGAGPEYANTVRCLNRQLLRAVDAIVRHDPDAMIFLQGDHGPGFGIDFEAPMSSWSEGDRRQRFSILSAARLPSRCPDRRAPELAVNTFRQVVSCVTGERVEPLPKRQFTVGYDSAGTVEELAAGP